MDILIKAAQLFLSLSILVIFHELGHFGFAKLFKIKVEKFYLFFDPWFSLFKFKFRDTEYGVGWIPLGGYVKIAGMIDESMDKEQLKKPPEPWEFRAKPAWQRLLVMIGGVLVNFLLAIFIYIFTLFYYGEEHLPPQNAKYGVVCDSIALAMGMQNGDKIISIDNEEIDDFYSIRRILTLDNVKTIQIERNGKIIDIAITSDLKEKLLDENKLFEVRRPFIVNQFVKGSNAEKAGLLPGDKLIGINDKELLFYDEYPPYLAQLKNQEVIVKISRDNEKLSIPVKLSENGKLGIYAVWSLGEHFTTTKIEYSFLASIPAGVTRGYDEIGDYLKQIKLIFTEPKATEKLGGFIAIGNVFPSEWIWEAFWLLTAVLSIMLAVVNILPIPALDGGHVMFVLFEIISGRKPSEKFLEYSQIVGMVILFGLIIFANGNDIWKLIQN